MATWRKLWRAGRYIVPLVCLSCGWYFTCVWYVLVGVALEFELAFHAPR